MGTLDYTGFWIHTKKSGLFYNMMQHFNRYM
ncbi:hypothetical protein NVIE_1107 [Nitrososphaera viennensis EN76]|uniref:Uncharacterized protein n=1 Tax=Nitrososphaera viennensis EN76 TaxID=926571 RepID=A0A060HP19_9ARCH|nr:hypothetical protein NVIE_1107 [Nitrososphaera viennensis EN76]